MLNASSMNENENTWVDRDVFLGIIKSATYHIRIVIKYVNKGRWLFQQV